MGVDLPRVRPNTPPSAKAEDRFRRALEWLSRIKAGPGLVMTRSGLARDVPPAMDVRLVGASSPYAGVEQVGTAGGGWADKAGGATVSCFEFNAQAGLGGSVVRVRLIGPDWRFAYNRIVAPYVLPGLPCGPCNIPEQDLFLSWTYSRDAFGDTATVAVTLHYTAGTPPTWISGTVATGGFGNPNPPFIGSSACGPETSQSTHYFEVKCGASQVALFHNTFCAPISDWRAFQYGMIDSTYSCSPFSADWSAAQLTGGDKRMVLTA